MKLTVTILLAFVMLALCPPRLTMLVMILALGIMVLGGILNASGYDE